MAIIPSNKTEIFFNTIFPDSVKKNICQGVIDEIKNSQITELYDLKYNYSAEGGIELPKTNDWFEYLESHPDEHVRTIHKYQTNRQLRFIIDNNDNIIGARCKDGINLFTDDELDKIMILFNKVYLS
jgi:hypothetical protein